MVKTSYARNRKYIHPRSNIKALGSQKCVFKKLKFLPWKESRLLPNVSVTYSASKHKSSIVEPLYKGWLQSRLNLILTPKLTACAV